MAKRDEKNAEDLESRSDKREFFQKELERIGLKLEWAQQDSHVTPDLIILQTQLFCSLIYLG